MDHQETRAKEAAFYVAQEAKADKYAAAAMLKNARLRRPVLPKASTMAKVKKLTAKLRRYVPRVSPSTRPTWTKS